jgi:dolichol-phosphate mannosyltransferase
VKPLLYAIIPVFNEASNVAAVCDSLRRLGAAVEADFTMSVVFVDDGSSDGTAQAISSHKGGLACEILSHSINQGPGAAFAAGFSSLRGRLGTDDWVLTMEGDATSTADAVSRMLRRRLEGYDAVLASPYLYGGGFSRVSPPRVLVSHAANALVKIFLGIRGILTFSCFLRLYRGRLVLDLQERFGPGIVESKGFESMVELLGKMVLMNVRISEVEMKVDWSARKGKSKMRSVKTAAAYLRLFTRWKSLVAEGRGK